ncbi:Uu.00g052630.m01.CDS01 [Anthostomella pinea]|uniref:Uu.00g052630.m01.CDS01 n=1 Tax=Anthostomella pinea TaxID=933095 RepID=A0AAI8VWB6_9PEZI|nr:Uu.00g052630.m01.CDS01 [Anthostomella pinea]
MSSSNVREFEDQLRHAWYIAEVLDRKMTSSASTATPMKHAFTRHVEEVKTPKSDVNTLILDYLTVAGYPNAAAKFSTEANLQPQQPTSAIQSRQRIRTAIHKGEIAGAIEDLNELDPSILDKDEPLHFALLRLQLMELIRACNNSPGRDITPALQFARDQLGPRAATNPEFLEDLEKTMSLLVFEQNDALDPSLAALLKPGLRREVADNVNKAILERQQQRKEAAICQLVRMRAWAENTTRKDTKKDLPARIELGLDGDDTDKQDGQDGHEPMNTT